MRDAKEKEFFSSFLPPQVLRERRQSREQTNSAETDKPWGKAGDTWDTLTLQAPVSNIIICPTIRRSFDSFFYPHFDLHWSCALPKHWVFTVLCLISDALRVMNIHFFS